MDLSFFGGEAIQIKRKSFNNMRDEYGKKLHHTDIIDSECVIGVSSTDEEGKPFNRVEDTTLTLIFDANTDVREGDTFSIRGVEWEPVGGIVTHDSTLFRSSLFQPPKKIIVRRIGVYNDN